MVDQLIEVGSVRKTHGIAGELKFIVEEDFAEDFEEVNFVFIGRNEDVALPFEITSIRGADWIVKLADVESKEAGAVLCGQPIFIKQEDVSPDQAQEVQEVDPEFARYRRLEGFALIDEAIGEVGQIQEVIAYPHQVLAQVQANEKQHLIPLNQDLIKGVDFIKKIVFMRLPEGLLEL